jgi:1-acyl-sn-glycerol-3-phosphate acyltransferase
MLRALRVIKKTVIIFLALQVALAEFAARTIVRRRALNLHERTRWLQRLCRRILKVLPIEIELHGEIPSSGLLVANHLSYLDILVFGALAPAVFVAKMEVRSWLLIGWFARLGGAIFLDRWKLRRWPEVVAQVEAALQAGELVVAFPEATTTDGSAMLPFRPAMFEGAIRCRAPVTAAHIWYTLEDGSFGRSLCWFGDVHGTLHLLRMFAQRRIRAYVTVGSQRVFDDRKRAAEETFAEVSRVHQSFTAMDAKGADRYKVAAWT